MIVFILYGQFFSTFYSDAIDFFFLFFKMTLSSELQNEEEQNWYSRSETVSPGVRESERDEEGECRKEK